MSGPRRNKPPSPTGPRVLVVDDDRRVLDLLEIAFAAHGFRVITASDGEEALRRATSEQPDLVVLDVRLPRKSGLEVCELLRGDPDEAHIPIILVSAAAETDARLRGLACGADDYLAKPFSPKELIARVKRLLARSADANEARRQSQQLQRELSRVKDQVNRTHMEARHENRLREIALGPGRHLQRTLDVDVLARRFLMTVQSRLGLGVAGLLVRDSSGTRLVPRAIRGDGLDRLAGLTMDRDGELAHLLAGLGRPASRMELEDLRELREEMPPFVACGFVVLCGLVGPEGLEGLVVADERVDGHPLSRTQRDELQGLCEMTADALYNASRVRAQTEAVLDVALARSARPSGTAREEAWVIVDRAARATMLAPRQHELLRRAIALQGCTDGQGTRQILARLAPSDPTGRVAELAEALEQHWPTGSAAAASPDARRAELLLAVARRYILAREEGLAVVDALLDATVQAGAALDPTTAQALNAALREPLRPANA